MIEIRKGIIPAKDQLMVLYSDAMWSEYTKHPSDLIKAVENSNSLYCAYDDGKLVGLIRAVGDNVSIMYIQDLLILKTYQHQGLGKKLLETFMKDNADVRQLILMTDNDEETIEFYRESGFAPVEEYYLTAMIHRSHIKKQA
jgi:ribosomal protein S18 acetylase RimI-like enzyme